MKYLVAALLIFSLGWLIYLKFKLDDRTTRINSLESQIKEWKKLSSQSFVDSVGIFSSQNFKIEYQPTSKEYLLTPIQPVQDFYGFLIRKDTSNKWKIETFKP